MVEKRRRTCCRSSNTDRSFWSTKRRKTWQRMSFHIHIRGRARLTERRQERCIGYGSRHFWMWLMWDCEVLKIFGVWRAEVPPKLYRNIYILRRDIFEPPPSISMSVAQEWGWSSAPISKGYTRSRKVLGVSNFLSSIRRNFMRAGLRSHQPPLFDSLIVGSK